MIERQMTEKLSTKRASFSSGKRAAAVANLRQVVCSPAYPAGPDDIAALRLDASTRHPYSIFEVYVNDWPDILKGDTVVLDEVEYRVEGVGKWKRRIKFMKLIVQDVESDDG